MTISTNGSYPVRIRSVARPLSFGEEVSAILIIARLRGRHWSAVITYRQQTIRLISVGRPRLDQRRVNVDFPLWMVEQLDLEASRLRVTRQSIIKVWLAERLERRRDSAVTVVAESSSS